jgi:thiosulfate/3-mercaptopyruvate sulfurtransferase
MTPDQSAFFVSTEWLAQHLDDPDLVVVEGSYFLPDENRNAREEYLQAHIPGAVRFDIDAIADHSTDLPHMLPSPQIFAQAMRDLGISDTMRIVVYDAVGLFGAARVWWTLRLFGAKDIKILAGGLPKWASEARPLESGSVTREPQTFTAHVDTKAVAAATDVLKASQTGAPQIVDARSAQRFRGEAPEPRPGVRSGHIPGSLNVPYRELIENGEMRAPADVAAAFQRAGVDLTRPIITTCGSGVTAAILLLGLETAGKTDVVLYDGSWSEWGSRPELPLAQG